MFALKQREHLVAIAPVCMNEQSIAVALNKRWALDRFQNVQLVLAVALHLTVDAVS